MTRNADHNLIRDIPGRKTPVGIPIGGPIGLLPIQLANEARKAHLVQFKTIGDQYDKIIAHCFEKLRQGLSVDSFLSSPNNSRELTHLCHAHSVEATEFQINMRLFALRKRASSLLSPTTDRTRADHLISEIGPGVESAMLQVYTRLGASVDDMIAHPRVGKQFVAAAKRISPGKLQSEYRLCALQIRKTRAYSDIADNLRAEELSQRWVELGKPGKLITPKKRIGSGIAELTDGPNPLFVLRSRNLDDAISHAFSPKVISQLLEDSWFAPTTHDLGVRYIAGRDLPKQASPKPWEIAILRDEQPPLNWPILDAA